MGSKESIQRVSIVTGGAGGLGQAISTRLHADGDIVVLADINIEAATLAAKRISEVPGPTVFADHVDMGDPESIDAFVARVGEKFGRIDVVVNNAAINRFGKLGTTSVEAWDAMMEINVRGGFLLCQAVRPYWEKQLSGSVVNIGSRAWLSGGAPAYVVTKAAVVGLTRALATELAPLNVTANAVAPSFMSTEFTRQGRDAETFKELEERFRRMTPLKRLTDPNDVANAVAFLASAQASYITGEILHVCGGGQMAPLP